MPEPTTAQMRKLTPVLVVPAVEPCLPFWVGQLGFAQTAEVRGDDGALVFTILQKDAVEIMYQTRASVLAGEPPERRAARERELDGHGTVLFLDVDDLGAVERAVAGAPVVKPRHDTFYGMTELYVREPGGTVVGFAAPTATGEATPEA